MSVLAPLSLIPKRNIQLPFQLKAWRRTTNNLFWLFWRNTKERLGKEVNWNHSFTIEKGAIISNDLNFIYSLLLTSTLNFMTQKPKHIYFTRFHFIKTITLAWLLQKKSYKFKKTLLSLANYCTSKYSSNESRSKPTDCRINSSRISRTSSDFKQIFLVSNEKLNLHHRTLKWSFLLKFMCFKKKCTYSLTQQELHDHPKSIIHQNSKPNQPNRHHPQGPQRAANSLEQSLLGISKERGTMIIVCICIRLLYMRTRRYQKEWILSIL